jgi:5'-nucleotidase
MNVKRILLTGDDGYNSVGTRVLACLLKQKYDVYIAATYDQQSGVGGQIHLKNEIAWGIEKVEGIDAIWVKGSPVDAIEFSQGYFSKKFDLVISGINWGENVGPAIITSGTFCAAYRAVGVKLTKRAMVMSVRKGMEDWNREHSKDEKIESYLDYPVRMSYKLIGMCIRNNFYKSKIININFPEKAAEKVKFTRLSDDITKYYFYPNIIDKEKKTFKYPDIAYAKKRVLDDKVDIGALNKGYISLTPLKTFLA